MIDRSPPAPLPTAADVLADLSPAVAEFCAHNDIAVAELRQAVRIASDAFCLTGTPVVVVEQDPEIDEDYLVIEIQATGTVAEIVASHREYTRRMVESFPWPKLHNVHLSYDIV